VSDNSSVKVDTILPRVTTFEMDDREIRIGDNATVTLVFSEVVCVVSSDCGGVFFDSDDDISHPNGLLSTMTTSDNRTWTGYFWPDYPDEEVDDDTNTLSLGTSYTDLAGNPGPDNETENYKVDTAPPTAVITMSDRFLRRDRSTGVADNATVTITFSEPIIGFDNSDITIPNLDQSPLHDNSTVSGTLDNMTTIDDNTTWRGTFTPTFPDTEDWSNTLSLAANSYTDVDNNTGGGATSKNYMVDDIYPATNGSATITIENNDSDNDSLLLADEDATVTVNFPEPVNTYSQGTDNCSSSGSGVSNLTSADFVIDNASTGRITSGPTTSSCLGTTWTATFTPYDDIEVLSNTITLRDDWTDQVGNPGFDNVTSVFEVETYRPRANLTITHSQGDNGTIAYGLNLDGFRPGDNGTLTVQFDDKAQSYDPEVYNFSNADITVPSYVSLSTMTTTDNITWTGTFTPVDNSTGSCTTASRNNFSCQKNSYEIRFSVSPTNYNDLKGNSGHDTFYSPYFVVDTKPPVVEHVRLHDRLTSTTYIKEDTFTKSGGSLLCIPVNSNIEVVFDHIMDPDSITADTSINATSCGGTLQVSSDNFNTCVRMSSDPAASSHDSITNKKFTLDPVDNLSYFTTYKVRATSSVVTSEFPKDALGNQMTSLYIHANEFRTSSFPSSTPTSGVFAAVGVYGSNFRSIDNGTSWDNETCQFIDTEYNGVTYANNTFVAVGENGRIVRSTDNASSWHVSSPSTTRQLNGIAFGGSTFDVVGHSGYSYRSTNNGSSWTSVTPPSQGSQGSPSKYYYNENLYGVAFGNSTFVAVGTDGKIVKSTDNGASWSHVTTGCGYPNNTCPGDAALYGDENLRGISFGNNTFVAVGSSGQIIRSTNDGSSWDNVTAVDSTYLRGVTFANNTFVAVGSSGKIIRSTDNGSSFDNVTSVDSTTLYGVTFGNNTFVAVGNNGKIIRSTDNGSSWNNSTSGTTNRLNGVSFGD